MLVFLIYFLNFLHENISLLKNKKDETGIIYFSGCFTDKFL